MQRVVRAVGGVVVAVAVLWVAVWLGAPPLLKGQLERRLSETLGRPVTVDRVAVRPWALEAQADGLAIAGAAGGSPLLTLERVRVNVSASSMFRLAPVIEALEVVRPEVHVARTAAGHYDIDDLLQRFAPKPDAPEAPPARFALYNVTVTDGAFTFDDKPVGRVHRLSKLQVGLPFVSNLPAQVDVTVKPHLAFDLNGAGFDSGAEATPFSPTRAGTLQLGVTKLDLDPYLGYVPASLPLRIVRGRLDSDLQASFTQAPEGEPQAALHGAITLTDVALATPDGQELLAWKALKLGLSEVQPLRRHVHLSAVTLDGLRVTARRGADGRIAGVPAASAALAPASGPAAPASAASATLAPKAAPAWNVQVDALAVNDGQVAWRDVSVQPAAALDLVDIAVKAERLAVPPKDAMPVSLSARLQTAGGKPQPQGRLRVTGEATTDKAQLQVVVDALALEGFKPYLSRLVSTGVHGRASLDATVNWAAGGDTPQVQLKVARAAVDDLKVTDPAVRTPRGAAIESLGWKQLSVEDVALDLPARTVAIGPVKLVQPAIALQRDGEGRWNVSRWRALSDETQAQAPVPASPPASAAAPWRVTLQQAVVEGGRIQVADAQVAVGGDPLRTEVSAIALDLRDAAFVGDQPTPPARVRFSAKTGTGQVRFDGKVGLVPGQASGTLAVTRLPVHAFAPYAGIAQNVSVARAEAGFKGNVAARWPAVEASVQGDVLLADVLLQTRTGDRNAPGDDLLQWQALALDGLRVDVKPGAKPRLEIASATLNELRARLVVTEQGRLNLQDAAGTRVGPDAPDPAASAPAGAASAPPPPVVAAASVPDAPASAAVAARRHEPLPVDLTIGATRLTNGRVDFTDNFVRPKYSAELSQLDGRLGTVSTHDFKTAELFLKGRAAGTADLEISGQVQPLARPISLDIQARASDLELAPLSPYAAKYVGYEIERGKLTMDVAYRIDPDGRLQARNQVIVNQLTFGEKVASPQATSLPVRLAVSLLTDRHGVIDIDLPVSGSLDDPEFSVAGMIWKVLGNVIAKAVTAPFSLLAGGGKTDISVLPAVPGTPRLTDAAKTSLTQVANALKDRPTLRLTITGTSDLPTEREAYRQQVLDTRLLAERRKESLATGGDPTAAVTLGAADRSRLLKLLYKQTDLPDKPRNALGFARDLPDDDMAARLKTQIPVDADTMRELALQRGVVVRDGIAALGVPTDRLFLAAPKGKADGDWVPSVKLDLGLK